MSVLVVGADQFSNFCVRVCVVVLVGMQILKHHGLMVSILEKRNLNFMLIESFK